MPQPSNVSVAQWHACVSIAMCSPHFSILLPHAHPSVELFLDGFLPVLTEQHGCLTWPVECASPIALRISHQHTPLALTRGGAPIS